MSEDKTTEAAPEEATTEAAEAAEVVVEEKGPTPKNPLTRGNRKTLVGVVISDRLNKTRVVRVQRLEMHPRYKKYVRRDSKLQIHDEEETSKVGDKVLIQETRPLSKHKRWRLVKVID